MRAALVPTPGGPEAVVPGEAPEPIVREGEVMVRVRAAGVNRADLLQAAGKYPPPPDESTILGLEAAGEVEGTGERVFFLLPGGGYAERVAVPRGMLMPIPERMSFVEAAAVPEGWFTAFLNLFLEGSLVAGERVLITAAASGVGTAGIQLARRAGATVIATSRSAEKLETLRDLGADLALVATGADLVSQVEAAYGRESVNVVLDAVGASLFPHLVTLLARRGRLVLIATMGGGSAELDLRAVLGRRLRIVGSTLRARPLAEKVALTGHFVSGALPGFVDGSLRPVVDSVLPLERAGDALARMAENRNVGKIVLEVA